MLQISTLNENAKKKDYSVPLKCRKRMLSQILMGEKKIIITMQKKDLLRIYFTYCRIRTFFLLFNKIIFLSVYIWIVAYITSI